jgi:myosin heavy subunit
MMLPRKLTFQLTPLLDLLLIVIFAQYMEVQDTTEHRANESTAQLTETQTTLSATEQQLQQAMQAHDRSVDELEVARERFAKLESESRKSSDEFASNKLALEKSLDQARQQRDLVGKLSVELFQLPEQSVRDVIRERMRDEPFLSEQEIEQLLEQYQEMSQQRGSQMVKHLLTYEELRKRCDIWQVYVAGNGKASFTANDQTSEFRSGSPDDFAIKMFARYKALPQPKSLVIILLSHGNLSLERYDSVTIGLTMATERMRTDSNGRTRFEYANLGYESSPGSLGR